MVSSRGVSGPRWMYDACRPQVWHVSVTRSRVNGTAPPPRRRGTRTIDRVAQEGQTKGTC